MWLWTWNDKRRATICCGIHDVARNGMTWHDVTGQSGGESQEAEGHVQGGREAPPLPDLHQDHHGAQVKGRAGSKVATVLCAHLSYLWVATRQETYSGLLNMRCTIPGVTALAAWTWAFLSFGWYRINLQHLQMGAGQDNTADNSPVLPCARKNTRDKHRHDQKIVHPIMKLAVHPARPSACHPARCTHTG